MNVNIKFGSDELRWIMHWTFISVKCSLATILNYSSVFLQECRNLWYCFISEFFHVVCIIIQHVSHKCMGHMYVCHIWIAQWVKWVNKCGPLQPWIQHLFWHENLRSWLSTYTKTTCYIRSKDSQIVARLSVLNYHGSQGVTIDCRSTHSISPFYIIMKMCLKSLIIGRSKTKQPKASGGLCPPDPLLQRSTIGLNPPPRTSYTIYLSWNAY